MVNLQDKPVVFLDIDGVLNHALWLKSEKYQQLRKAPPDKRDHLRDLDPTSIAILNEIADYNFVLSSTWRKIMPLEDCQDLLERAGFKGKLLDKTPILNSDCFRGNEVYKWLKNNNLGDFERYIIFDDDSDFLYWQKDNLFLVDSYCGITPNVIYRAKRFLDKLQK